MKKATTAEKMQPSPSPALTLYTQEHLSFLFLKCAEEYRALGCEHLAKLAEQHSRNVRKWADEPVLALLEQAGAR